VTADAAMFARVFVVEIGCIDLEKHPGLTADDI